MDKHLHTRDEIANLHGDEYGPDLANITRLTKHLKNDHNSNVDYDLYLDADLIEAHIESHPELSCINCDDRKCMACVCREIHDRCEDDCPTCCPEWLEAVDEKRRDQERRVEMVVAEWLCKNKNDLPSDISDYLGEARELLDVIAKAKDAGNE